MADRPRVSVVVLSHARPALLEQTLRSLALQTWTDCETLVVDNASDASAAVREVVAAFPEARLVASPVNLGYAGGMNLGWRAAAGEHVFLTEDDIVLAPDCVERLLVFAADRLGCGVTAPLMLNRGTGTIRCAGLRISLGPVYRQTVLGADEPDDGRFATPTSVEAVPGAAIFVRRDLLERLGGFREDFFLYYEDVEFCLRVRGEGLTNWVEPSARVWHHEPVVRPSPLTTFHMQKNLYALYALHAPGTVLPEFALRYVVAETVRALVREPARARRNALAALWVLRRLPTLLADRRRNRLAATPKLSGDS